MLVKTETEKMIRDREEMKREIEYLNQVCDNVLKEFEANIISTEEKEEMFKKELDESKSLIIESSMELEKLVKHVSSKDATIQKLTIASQKFTSNLKRIERDYKELERKHRHTMNEFQSLNVVLNSLRQDMGILNANHRVALEHIANLEQEKVLSAKELEDDKLLYKKHVEELARKCEEYEEDTASLQSEIADLRNKLENEKSAYSTLACLHKEISAKFMKIVKDMITIKNAKQEALSRANKLGEELAKIKSEKNLLEDKVLTIQNDVKHYENLYKQCLEKRMTLEKEITASHLQGPEEHEATLANCQKHQKMVESLQKDLKDSYDTIDELKLTVYDYKRQITDLELKRSEMNLKLHETQRRLNTEQALVEQLRNTHKLILAAVLEMKERGRVDSNDGGLLLSMVQSSANTTASDESIQRACLSDPTIEPVTNDK